MICRAGMVTGSPRSATAPVGRSAASSIESVSTAPSTAIAGTTLVPCARTSWTKLLLYTLVVCTALALLPGRGAVPPLVESDYCYLLIAADRLHDGLGPTSLQPVAPFQPWDWRYDWGFLTQWPVGYAVLIAAIRWALGVSAITAAKGVSVAACGLALVGWFTWARRCVPRGVTSVLLAALAASAVPMGNLLNPSTDAVLLAVLPIILLLTVDAQRIAHATTATSLNPSRPSGYFVLAGVLAGGLCWFRYAAVFVPVGLLLFLISEATRRRARLRNVVSLALGIAGPVLLLWFVNARFAATASVAERFNLGSSVSWNGAWSLVSAAWWKLTDFGYYSHRPVVHVFLAACPILILACGCCIPAARAAFLRVAAVPSVALSAITLIVLVLMLIGATAIFGSKFNFVALDRYYLPAKPLFVALIALPLMLVPRRVVRFALSAAAIVCAIWVVQVDWARAYQRAIARQTGATPYGQWARCFPADGPRLYEWLGSQASKDLVIVSNYHETVALETGLPTLPIPPSRDELSRWVDRIAASRGIATVRVLFILDDDNRWRSHWIPDPAAIRRTFGLTNPIHPPGVTTDHVFEYSNL